MNARTPNRLARETSPYLIQHARNPVEWHPWGDEAFAEARAGDKPVFLSVGYSACHWCHVMERESFENEEIAAYLNQHFVSVKVDREERPDIDQIYMAAVQALSGHGGWPMSVFLTPTGHPFFGGTYYPPTDQRGMPGFMRILQAIHKAWSERRDEVVPSATQLTEHLSGLSKLPQGSGQIERSLIGRAADRLRRAFDPEHGGFGNAPKFPHAMDLRLLLRSYAAGGNPADLHAAVHSLDRMAKGGIYDHLGGGFARYSTDERWHVPHFEKMLYDNALLIASYSEAHQITGRDDFAQVIRETIGYVLSRMKLENGGFAAAEDADSEGVEGKYYVWSLGEILEILGPERGQTFASYYNATAPGNWEGTNILFRTASVEEAAPSFGLGPDALRRQLAEDRERLLEVRERRVHPGKDTKVLTSWNGLMIGAFADATWGVDSPEAIAAAAEAADFLLAPFRGESRQLSHSCCEGSSQSCAFLDDYANLIDGLTRLFEATGEARWLDSARDLARIMLAEFADPADGSFFYTGQGHEKLIFRPKEQFDNATPSATAMAATALVRLGALLDDEALAAAGEATLSALEPVMESAPMASGQALIALDFHLGPRLEIVVVEGDDPAEFAEAMKAVRRTFLPRALVIPVRKGGSAPALALLEGKSARDGRTTVYCCRDRACDEPWVGLDAISRGLEQAASLPRR